MHHNGLPPTLFRAAVFVALLCLGFCGGEVSALSDLRGMLGGPKKAAQTQQALPINTQRFGLHVTATQTCGNVSFPCPTGYTAKAPTTVCNTTTCTVAECCAANPSCGSASVACSVVSAPLSPSTTCAASVCTEAECCAAATSLASQYLRMKLNVPCATMTQDQLKAEIQASTGVPASAVVITSFSCTPTGLDVTLTTLGSTPALANNALNLIAQAASAGAFGQPIFVTFTPFADPVLDPANRITTTTTSTTYPTSYATTTLPSQTSSSNPALLGLLALLAIPLLLLIGLLWLCLRPKPCPPVCISCPAPMCYPC